MHCLPDSAPQASLELGETCRNGTGGALLGPTLDLDGGRMTTQEPHERPPRPPQGAAGPPRADGPADASGTGDPPGPADQPPRVIGPPVDPYQPDPAQADTDSEEPYEGVPYRPDPYESPHVSGSALRPEHVRTEQMQRNAEYHEAQAEQASPYRAEGNGRSGSLKWEAPVQTMPTDPVRPFVSRGVPRKRGSDWPVFVFALVVAAVVTMGCCLAGFATFAAWNPFGG